MYQKIHFTEIINKIWKEKLLIFLISIVFSLLAYFLSLNLTKKYLTQITLKNPPFYLFDDYSFHISNINNDYLNNLFSLEINNNLLDITNLEKFIDQSTEFDSFKIFLKSRNISVKEYFKKNKIEIKHLNNISLVFINHTNDLDGKLFLESYIKYIKDISITQLKITLRTLISNRIKNVGEFSTFLEDEEDTNFANSEFKKSNELSILNKMYKIEKKISISLIYSQLTRLNGKLDNDNFDYKIISSANSNQEIIDKDKESIAYSLMGLIFGLFLSLAFIFLRK
jgi:hypothetical protein